MGKLKVLIITFIFIVLIAIAGYFTISIFSQQPISNNEPKQSVEVTEENFASYLQSTDLVQDLPKSAVLSLKTTNKEYVLTRGSAVEGKSDNPDLTISVPSSYIAKLSYGLCSTLDEANKNGDLNVETHLSQTALLWKYKSMIKYRTCLGF